MIVNLTKRFFAKLSRKAYRAAYVAEQVQTSIAYQIRALREQRGWNQGKLAFELNKPQSVVSARLENPDYGKLTLTSLLEVASAFDVALIVRYVSFPEFLRQAKDVSQESFEVESFSSSSFVSTGSGERMVADATTSGYIFPRDFKQGLPRKTIASVGKLEFGVH